MSTTTTLKIHKRSPETLAAMQRKIAELARQRDVMIAYVEKDAAIEHRGLSESEWYTSAIPQFDWRYYDYRVRPAPHTVKLWHKEGCQSVMYNLSHKVDFWIEQGWTLVEYEEKIS